MTTPRRVPRPVRLTLAAQLGSDIDGAWWPRGSSVSRELSELVSALHPKLGEIIDIRINWSATEGASDLLAVAMGTSALAGMSRRPRLMCVAGQRSCVKLLVIPSTTSLELGSLVLRIAAGLDVRGLERSKLSEQSAHRVLLAAQAASSDWNRVDDTVKDVAALP